MSLLPIPHYIASSSVFIEQFSYDNVSYDPGALALNLSFADGGSYLFGTVDGTGDPFMRTALTTPYDLSSASTTSSYSQSDERQPSGVGFNPAGTKMIMLGRSNATTLNPTLYEYDLSTAFLPSSRTLQQTLDISSFVGLPFDIKVVDSGNKAFWADVVQNEVGGISLSSYTLITSGYSTYSLDISSQTTSPYGVTFNCT